MSADVDGTESTYEKERRPDSTSGLLSSLATDVSELMRGEVYLARAELRTAINDVKKGAIGIGIGTAVLTGGVLTLIAFAVLAIADGMNLDLWLSALIVGVIATFAGILLLKSGASKLSADNLTPSRLRSSLHQSKRMVKKKLS